MKPIGVIGISGFVGSHVAAALSAKGVPVRGILRNPDGAARTWIEEKVASEGPVELRPGDLTEPDSLVHALEGCSGIVMSAGTEAQEPATLSVMVGAAQYTLDAAEALGIDRVVFTSSTGSTNPPEGEPEVKTEAEAWSDPGQQVSVGKFSPAAKTLMERTALGRMARSDGLRVAIFCPSMIVGDRFGEEPSGVVRFVASILSGERFADGAPNGSMSMIHVDDLAALHVAALEQSEARGRYFGVVRSWHWQEILEALARVAPDYEAPAWPQGRDRARPTTFDLSRRDSLGVELRGLDAMLADAVEAAERRGLVG